MNLSLARSQRWGLVPRKMMSQEIAYVNLWVTACTHYFWSVFILETTKHTQRIVLLRDLFSNIHQRDAHITHAWIHTRTHMHTHCQQCINHPVKPLTLLITYRCSVCYDLPIIHHYTEVDRIILISFINYWSVSKKPLIGKDCGRSHYKCPSKRTEYSRFFQLWPFYQYFNQPMAILLFKLWRFCWS